MASPGLTPKSAIEKAAATRRVHGAALGYQPMRMKPVHFATSFLLALRREYFELETLNKASVPRAAPKRGAKGDDPYVAEILLPDLQAAGRVSASVDLHQFKMLRAHLNAAFNNDGAALTPAFAPYKTFGSDYSAPSLAYITNLSKNHGYSGSFVVSVLRASPVGQAVLADCEALLALPAAPLHAFGRPLLPSQAQPWTDDYSDQFPTVSVAEIARVATLMAPQTDALHRLLQNLLADRSVYALRYMIIGLCSWLFVYMMRRGQDRPLLLLDALGGGNQRIRMQSRASYARQLDVFSRNHDVWRQGPGAGEADAVWDAFANSGDARQTLEDHFRDLGVRIGFIQPRAPSAKRKHAELQADTLRVLALSLLEREEVLTVVEFAQKLREVWRVCSGADPADVDELREAGFVPLDQDEDLEPNGQAFAALLVRLGLATQPSDGLTLCALKAEELI